MYDFFSILTLLLSLLPFICSLGINCHGSIEYPKSQLIHLGRSYNILASFSDALTHGNSYWIPGGPALSTCRWGAGDHIVCLPSAMGVHKGDICLFAQGNVTAGGIDTQVVLQRINDLYNHKCQACGSVPISGDNDPDKMGILMSNYIRDTVCNGVCDHVC